MKSKGLSSLVSIVVIAVGLLAATIAAGNKPLLGLDLKGGAEVVLEPVDDSGLSGSDLDDALDQAAEIIRNRVDGLGVAEPDITVQGQRIVVQLPGIDDQERALEIVGQTAELRFRPVLDVISEGSIEALASAGESTDGGSTDGGSTDGEATPEADSTPAAEVTPDGEATPEPEGTPAAETTTEPEATPEDGATRQATTPDAEATPDAETPAADETPSADETPAAEETPPAEATPEDANLLGPVGDDSPYDGPFDCNPNPLRTDEMVSRVELGEGIVTAPADDAACDIVILTGQFGDETFHWLLGPTLLTGSSLDGATSSFQSIEYVVRPTFKGGAEGIDKFNEAATACYNQSTDICPSGQLAIVLDGTVVSAPNVNAPVFDRDQITISGSFDQQEADDLAVVLRYGALPLRFKDPAEGGFVRVVSATLGKDSLRAGIIAGLIGFAIVALYMIAYYRLLGLAAILSLLVSGSLLYTIVSFLSETRGLALTLAGVTGLVVSVGTSLDTNVVYFEHLKETVANGRTLRSSVDRSFPVAFRTIFWANLASLIGAAILYFLTAGSVRGFALMLGLASILDLVATYFFLRPVVRLIAQRSSVVERPGLFGIPADLVTSGQEVTAMSGFSNAYRNNTNVNFPRMWPRAALVIGALLLISVVALLVRGLNLGIEFEGGAAWEVDAHGVSTAEARDALRPLGLADARIQTGDDILRVRAELDQSDQKVDEVSQALSDLTGTPLDEVNQTVVGASWGDEITKKAVRALIVFFIVIAIYITLKLEWAMAVAALFAVANDIVVTVGIYALFQFEVTSATVIAFLTIMGYSLYDTIVVFDKVKDNEGRLAATGKLSYPGLMNMSLNQVLMRGVNTTVTSILPVLSLLLVGSLILGAVTLQEFGIALLIGLLSGALSSFFIAAPVTVWLKERFDSRYAEARERAVARAGGTKEAREAVRSQVSSVEDAKAQLQGPDADFGTGGAPRGRKQGKRR